MPNATDLQEWMRLDAEVSRLKDELRKVNEGRDTIEARLLEQFQQEGVQNMKINGRTVYVRRDIWAGAVKGENGEADFETSCEALRAAGLEAFVHERFNAQTVSAWVRELPRDDNQEPILPPVLAGKLNVQSTYSLRSRKG